MTSFTKFTMSASFPHQRRERERVNIGTVRNAPAIPDNYIILPVTKQEKPSASVSASMQSDIDFLRNDNKKTCTSSI
jgi:hypothetical protein